MPDETIVASWRVMIVRSLALTRDGSLSSIDRPVFFSCRLVTVRPRERSSSVAACLESPVTSPFWGTPVASVALKVKVAAPMALRGHRRLELDRAAAQAAVLDQAPDLGGLVGAALGGGHGDAA